MVKKNYSLLLALVFFLAGFLPYGLPVTEAGYKYPGYMQGIEYGTEVTYVIGHNPPDSDSVCTAIAYANLKRQLGVNAEARIASPINAESAYALRYFGVKEPSLLANAAAYRASSPALSW